MSKSTENWKCNFCGEEKEILYFVGSKELCDDCKKKAILGEKEIILGHGKGESEQ